jgi:anti-sigma regulatory factor (Ser/Thr protein kinase)
MKGVNAVPTATAGDTVACLNVPAEAPAVSQCRRFLVACARRWSLRSGVDEATLALSELVSNAVEHAGGPIAVEVARRDGELHIDVTAPATEEVPRLLCPSRVTASGRGLRIVAALATSWGWRDIGARRTVWAAVAL